MTVIWTPEALQDRLDIWEYIATETLVRPCTWTSYSVLLPHWLTSPKRVGWERSQVLGS